jgi:hypothetical protein
VKLTKYTGCSYFSEQIRRILFIEGMMEKGRTIRWDRSGDVMCFL